MTQKRRKLVAGNWKMNGSLAGNASLMAALADGLASFKGADVAVCVPAPYLSQVGGLVANVAGIALGAQTLNENAAGAFTGEVSVAMLKDFSCRYVIVGHSERRALYGETNAQVAAKFVAAAAAGLVPIACVGETWPERQAGATEAVIGAQLDALLDTASDTHWAAAVVAYEPVWAIGTGKTASPEEAQAVHAFIRARIAARHPAIAASLRILYGGSVGAANAAGLFACADIDGGLVGGASLKAADFVSICIAASNQDVQ
jgi:triosephosphate isomerase